MLSGTEHKAYDYLDRALAWTASKTPGVAAHCRVSALNS